MNKTEFQLRTDERSRFETELLLPLALVWSIATIVLFSSSGTIPGQFTGRHFAISWWQAVLAGVVLLVVIALRIQRPRRYEATDEGLDIVQPFMTYRIPYSEIREVVALSERSDAGFGHAIAAVARRTGEALWMVGMRISGRGAVQPPREAHGDFTTCDNGGVEILCKDGKRVLLSPAELSAFLTEMEWQFRRKNLDAKVVRETRVTIG